MNDGGEIATIKPPQNETTEQPVESKDSSSINSSATPNAMMESSPPIRLTYPKTSCIRVICTVIIMPIVFGMIALTYYPFMMRYVFEASEVTVLSALALLVFHASLSVMLASLWKVWSTNPNGNDAFLAAWSEEVKKNNNVCKYRYCKRTKLYKPPRCVLLKKRTKKTNTKTTTKNAT